MKRRAVWKTVPHDKLIVNIMNYELYCSFALRLSAHALKKVTDNTDATDFIFHRFNNIMRYHLILDLLRIAFAPIRRGITASKR